MGGVARGQHDLAEKLTKLMDAAGSPATEKLADAIKEHTGTSISGAYLWQLKKGKRNNLTLQHLTALSSYFSDVLGLPITLSYFDPSTPADAPWRAAEEADRVEELQRQLNEERQFSQAMADRGIRRIAQRLGQMDAAQQRQFLAIADAIASTTPASGGSREDSEDSEDDQPS
ncbi:MAG: hypothetical protein EKK42_07890 [Pseudonocardiaceae bacterium]|nr:MAG: hypothetical protein EKK42_07890 [Pseudonocardiaceae bacterium]